MPRPNVDAGVFSFMRILGIEFRLESTVTPHHLVCGCFGIVFLSLVT